MLHVFSLSCDSDMHIGTYRGTHESFYTELNWITLIDKQNTPIRRSSHSASQVDYHHLLDQHTITTSTICNVYNRQHKRYKNTVKLDHQRGQPHMPLAVAEVFYLATDFIFIVGHPTLRNPWIVAFENQTFPRLSAVTSRGKVNNFEMPQLILSYTLIEQSHLVYSIYRAADFKTLMEFSW